MSRKSKKGKDLSIKSNTVEIPLAFTKENLATLLTEIINDSCIYSHRDFADWAADFHMYYTDLFDMGIEVDEKLEELAFDIDAQWELHLSNTYSLKELQTMNFSEVTLPKEWFKDWLKQLREI